MELNSVLQSVEVVVLVHIAVEGTNEEVEEAMVEEEVEGTEEEDGAEEVVLEEEEEVE